MVDLIKPNNKEVNKWILDTVKHSLHVEYYLNKLELGKNDPERPHDLVGENNKFDWNVLRGLALVYRKPKVGKEQTYPSIELHRNQYHHKMWNQYNKAATADDLFVGVVDATCALLESRVYIGGKEQRQMGKKHSWEEALDKLNDNDEQYKVDAANVIVPRMMEFESPNLELICSLNNIPNIGVPKEVYQKIKERVKEIAIDLSSRGYNILG